ncbi:hypothetical protein CANINC_002737 [Pichia inconspicua]|uniref:RNA helicase n=1 Tax=Pichia inconspicua TaxID=52247 RepID=A0A4T0X251_9ASCO|nr:hypothetical protein CANINC_002737 [[Candida] inconspicua]
MAKKNFYGKANLSELDSLNEVENQLTETNQIDNILNPHNTNAVSGIEKEKSSRKRKLKEKLLEQHKEKLTRQKKKRLDKYIEHQLKREEKEILLKKLEETRIDTSILRSAKLIGTGDKKTKKERIIEALELERNGKGTKETHELLYEERKVKNWKDILDEDVAAEAEKKEENDIDTEEEFKSTSGASSGFIDYRPVQPFTGMGTGFGFSNIEKSIPKKKKKKNYSWRAKIEADERKSKNEEDELDFASDSDDEEIMASGSDHDASGDDDLDISPDESDSDLEDSDNLNNGGQRPKAGKRDQKSSGTNGHNTEDIDEDTGDDTNHGSDSDSDSASDDDGDDGDDDDDDDGDGDDDDDDGDDDDDDDDDVEFDVDIKKEHTQKAKDFKQWAEEQVLKIEGREAFVAPTEPQLEYKGIVRAEDLEDGLQDDFVPINDNLKRKIVTVPVVREAEIQDARSKLPVYAEESKIMEAIHHNDCVIICGETGSGKTTQVPQFLFESGYGVKESDTPGMIGITQPRRVAAVSMAKRVGNELGNYSSKVGYQIRFDATVGEETSLKFMTDGVLLREMMTDFLLMKYSALIIDEAHERNVNTDILIGMLSRVLKLRREYSVKHPEKFYPLKLIIMSATLRVSDFSENKVLFDVPPPILKVDSRQFPVSIHFSKKTPFEYTEEAFRKTCKIHRKLPKGAILVFLTGKAEITAMVKKLRKEFPFPDNKKKEITFNNNEDIDLKIDGKNADVEVEEIDFQVNDLEINEDYNEEEEEEGEEGFEESLEEDQTENDPLYVLPLYSLLPTNEQMKIFESPPAGSRLCVIATNVAETSLTIPGVRYVVDCGRAKERKYDEETGVQSFEIDWISKASADQRSGRAGRTGPGHCYRLYSSAVYESEFPQFSKPEILRMPVEGVVLNMKSMGIQTVANFPFPTPPNREMLRQAENLLKYLGALDRQKGQITNMGKKMSLFPLSPRFSKILLIANQQGCLPYVIALVSGLTVGDPFLSEYDLGIQFNEVSQTKDSSDMSDDEKSRDDYERVQSNLSQLDLENKRKLRQKYNKSNELFMRLDKYSDSLKLLSAICAADHIPKNKRSKFYESHFLREKQMTEIIKLRKQLTYIVRVHTSKDGLAATSKIEDEELKLEKPTKQQVQAIKQMIAAGFIDQVAFRLDTIDKETKLSNNMKIINVPYFTPSYLLNHSKDESYVFIHPNSVIVNSGKAPEYLVYSHLQKSSKTGKSDKVRMLPLNDITSIGLTNVGKNTGLITFSKPLGLPIENGPDKRECHVIPRYGADLVSGGGGVDLAPQRVIQKKIAGVWTVV